MHPLTDRKALELECAQTTSFESIVAIAIREARKFPSGCHITCGPISTGGRGTIEANLQVFSDTIDALRSVPHPVFNQMPYEAKIFEFRAQWISQDPATRSNQYYMDILERFYLPLFESGTIKRAWFIPNWRSSFGAGWERQQFERLSIEISDLTHEWLEDFIIRQ